MHRRFIGNVGKSQHCARSERHTAESIINVIDVANSRKNSTGGSINEPLEVLRFAQNDGDGIRMTLAPFVMLTLREPKGKHLPAMSDLHASTAM